MTLFLPPHSSQLHHRPVIGFCMDPYIYTPPPGETSAPVTCFVTYFIEASVIQLVHLVSAPLWPVLQSKYEQNVGWGKTDELVGSSEC